MKKVTVPICTVHSRFQDESGNWRDIGGTFSMEHFLKITTENERLESPCDLCNDPHQIEIEFEEVKPDYSGMMGNNSGEEE